jgi:hypothetical protein
MQFLPSVTPDQVRGGEVCQFKVCQFKVRHKVGTPAANRECKAQERLFRSGTIRFSLVKIPINSLFQS